MIRLKLPCASFHFQEPYFGGVLLQDSPKKSYVTGIFYLNSVENLLGVITEHSPQSYSVTKFTQIYDSDLVKLQHSKDITFVFAVSFLIQLLPSVLRNLHAIPF